jgi:hypothetical protein
MEARPLLAALLLGIAAAGCGPIQSAAAISDCESLLDEARSAEAPDLAPYPYHRAEAFLELAKVKAGFSEFEIATELARNATKSAEEALQEARKKLGAKKRAGSGGGR